MGSEDVCGMLVLVPAFPEPPYAEHAMGLRGASIEAEQVPAEWNAGWGAVDPGTGHAAGIRRPGVETGRCS